MYVDDLLMTDEFEDMAFGSHDFFVSFRDLNGTYRVGRLEDDPQMMEYEEIMELGYSLGSVAGN